MTHRRALGPLGFHEDGGTGASIPQGRAGFQAAIDVGQKGNRRVQTPGICCLVGRIQIQ